MASENISLQLTRAEALSLHYILKRYANAAKDKAAMRILSTLEHRLTR